MTWDRSDSWKAAIVLTDAEAQPRKRTHTEELEAAIREANPLGWFVPADVPGWSGHAAGGGVATLRYRGVLARREIGIHDSRRATGAFYEYLLLA